MFASANIYMLHVTLLGGIGWHTKWYFFGQVNLRYFVSDFICQLFDITNVVLGCNLPWGTCLFMIDYLPLLCVSLKNKHLNSISFPIVVCEAPF